MTFLSAVYITLYMYKEKTYAEDNSEKAEIVCTAPRKGFGGFPKGLLLSPN